MELFKLIDLAIDQIKTDIDNGDYTAIVELLKSAKRDALVAYLPESATNPNHVNVTATVQGHWEDEPHNHLTYTVAIGEWRGRSDEEDARIFYYCDTMPKVGDRLADIFIVTAVEAHNAQ